eukprot:6212109-Pleurochrysis_carterae.AAC.2
MCDVAREECTASVRGLEEHGWRRATCHSNSPPRRMNGNNLRCPEASGGSSSARVLAKWQSVLFADQSRPTERSESRMDETQRTSVRVKSIIRFCESLANSGRSPTATQGLGFPSTPDTVSVHGRMFTKSFTCGLRAWRSLWRAVRVATRARGFEVMCKSVHAVRAGHFTSTGATGGWSAAVGIDR